jgi:site-specific DNA recombinase
VLIHQAIPLYLSSSGEIPFLLRLYGEQAKLAAKVFELSRALEQKWVGAEYPEKRQMLDLVCLNFSLDDVSLVAEMRKPFNMLAEGPLVLSSRGDRIRTCDL